MHKAAILHNSRRPLPASPTLPEVEVPLDPTFSLPLLYFFRSLPLRSFPFNSFPSSASLHPFSRHPSSSDRGHSSSLGGPRQLPLRQKSTSEIQRLVIQIFVTTVDGVTTPPGLAFSQQLKKSLQNQAGKVFKKKQLGENSRGILYFSHSFSILSLSSDSK